MELRQVRNFAAVARVGSYLGAAAEQDVPQPSLWRSVKALEKEFGVTLFERSGRGVRLTSAGRLLLPRVEQLLERAEGVSVLAAELAHGRAGVVSIACAHPHVPRFLAPLVGGFRRTHPGVHVAVHESSGLPSVEQVLNGDVDFVTALPRTDVGLVGHRLGDVRLVVVTSEDHPWRHRTEIPVSDLAGVPVLTGAADSLTRRLLEPAVREGGFTLDVTLETGNAPTLVAMARAGLGVAVLADDNLAADPVTTWPGLVDDRYPMTTPIWIYRARQRSPGPSVEDFARHIQRALSPSD